MCLHLCSSLCFACLHCYCNHCSLWQLIMSFDINFHICIRAWSIKNLFKKNNLHRPTPFCFLLLFWKVRSASVLLTSPSPAAPPVCRCCCLLNRRRRGVAEEGAETSGDFKCAGARSVQAESGRLVLGSTDDNKQTEAPLSARRWDRHSCCWKRSISPWTRLHLFSITCSLELGPLKLQLGMKLRYVTFLYIIIRYHIHVLYTCMAQTQ